MRKCFLLILLITFSITGTAWGTLLLEENFDYNIGDNITDHSWVAFSSGGTNPITVSSGGLSFSGYASSGIGNAALLDNIGEDDKKGFAEQTSGTVYASFLVNVTTARAGYFFHFRSGTSNIARVFVKTNSDFKFGLTKNADTGNYTESSYSYNNTYLVVLKYEFKPGSGDDEVSLFVFSSGEDFSSEPGSPTLGPYTDGNDLSGIEYVALRQYHSNQNITVDGIRMGTTWDDAPLPVELSIFTAQYLNNVPTLYWVTQSETDNIGWYVYRNTQNDFITSMIVSDLIPGFGTTTEPHSYIYEDYIENALPRYTYWYWLESIDFGGTINHYDKVAHIVIPDNNDPGNSNPEAPVEFGLFQNNPNPFNPKTEETTEISFNLKEQAYVEINIYNIKGELVKTIYNGFNTADEAVWDGKDRNGNLQATGIYFYELKVNNKVYSTKRIILIK